ncbi:MAG TPA: transglutaminase family protein [Acidimicrobiales bacterium]|nr:transglutaminase family protein [Acidimicrobiales bacterium]
MSGDEPSVRLTIRHVTGFSYDGVADSSYNEARMTPPTLPRQLVTDASLRVYPSADLATYRDYFDTIVTTFDLQEPHDRLQVIAEATVETRRETEVDANRSLSSLRSPGAADRFGEYLAPTLRTTMSPQVFEELREVVTRHEDVHATVDAVMARVRERVAYVRGATLVSSTAQEVWQQRQGVCQDLSHVTIALLRALGIPARYVSGYLYSKDDAEVGEMFVGESHAWVEYFCGEWVGIDPTNGGRIGLFHVIVARGREYGDVAPLKGIYHGDPSVALGVSVEITRVA